MSKVIELFNWTNGGFAEGDYEPSTGANPQKILGELTPYEGGCKFYQDGEEIPVVDSSITVNADGGNIIVIPDGNNLILAIAGKGNSLTPNSWAGAPYANPIYDGSGITYGEKECIVPVKRLAIALELKIVGGGGGGEVAGYSYQNNYLLTREQFNSFKSESFKFVKLGGGVGEFIDVSNWLNNVRLYPFKIHEDDLGVESNIIVSNESLPSVGTKIITDVVSLEFGSIEVLGVYNNAMDIEGVECELFLPYNLDTITLSPVEIMGKTISIKAYVVLADGTTTLNIYDEEDNLLSVHNTVIGRDIPLVKSEKTPTTNLTIRQAINSLRTAFIRVFTPEYSGRVLVERLGVLGDNVGYIEVMDSVRINATSTENEKLNSLLNRGVIIND